MKLFIDVDVRGNKLHAKFQINILLAAFAGKKNKCNSIITTLKRNAPWWKSNNHERTIKCCKRVGEEVSSRHALNLIFMFTIRKCCFTNNEYCGIAIKVYFWVDDTTLFSTYKAHKNPFTILFSKHSYL